MTLPFSGDVLDFNPCWQSLSPAPALGVRLEWLNLKQGYIYIYIHNIYIYIYNTYIYIYIYLFIYLGLKIGGPPPPPKKKRKERSMARFAFWLAAFFCLSAQRLLASAVNGIPNPLCIGVLGDLETWL